MERQTLKTYRQSLVHKARPMPVYKFFVPQLDLKQITIPKSPNFAWKKRQVLQKCASTESPYSLPDPLDMQSSYIGAAEMSPESGGSFLDLSPSFPEPLDPNFSSQTESTEESKDDETTVDETVENMQQ